MALSLALTLHMKKLIVPIAALLALMGQGCMPSSAPAPSPTPTAPTDAPAPAPAPAPTPTPTPKPNAQGTIYRVEIKGMKFLPNNFTVVKGTKIVVTNNDS